jgi:galactokinase
MRTLNMADLLAQSEWETCGRLMYASHESMRDDFEISCPEIDELVEIAKSIGINEGVYGSRMTGGGFGGCTVSLVQATHATQIGDTVVEQYKKKTGIEASYFITRPARGAIVIK